MTDQQPADAVRASDRAHGPGGAWDGESPMYAGLLDWADQVKPVGPGPLKIVTGGDWDRALAEAKSGPPVDEAAFREELAARAQAITAKINSGEIAHGLPTGYRFEFTPIDYRVADRMDLAAQVRGTAPEPPPDGFMMMPPEITEIFKGWWSDLEAAVRDRPKPPPLTRRQRLKRKIGQWRDLAARRAFKVIAGDWPDGGGDDW